MEMCYDGALVMPSSYAAMDEEEMMYLEGGISLSWDNATKVGLGILAVCGAVGSVLSMLNNAIKFGATVSGMTEAAFASAIGAKLASVVGRVTAWITSHFNLIAGIVCGAIAAIGGYAVGYYVGQRVFNH